MINKWTNHVLVISIYFRLMHISGLDVGYYTNKWIVHISNGEIAAKKVALDQNLTYKGPDIPYNGFYYMINENLPSKSLAPNKVITKRLKCHELVSTAFQEKVKAWSYRSNVHPSYVVPKWYSSRSNYRRAFNDNNWSDMWYLQDFRIVKTQPVLNLNVVPVYYQLKIIGKNVNIAVIDSGIDYTHPEISESFNPNISWNFIDENNDITPYKNNNNDNFDVRHGTKCTGIIIMKPNNNLCGVGIAYGAKVGGIKLLDRFMTISRISKALIYAVNNVDIYSNSWGTVYSGDYMEPLHELLKSSLSEGTKKGRNGKGVIYVFASGNGKKNGDNCACDGYVNSIHTIVVTACDQNGRPNYYSERCAAIMATAYTGDGYNKNVLTTNVNGQCVNSFSGTSSAVPMMSGVIGLALSANPKLTWRDIIHLLAWTSQVAPLSNNLGWNRNKAGFYYSVDFGFGLINAYKLVKKALTWKKVPNMKSCSKRIANVNSFSVSRNKAARIIVKSTGCEGSHNEVKFIEQVQIMLTMSYPKRGDIQISMESPGGTRVHVLESRFNDSTNRGIYRMTFLVLAFWGESPRGQFVIDIFDKTGSSYNEGKIIEMALTIHGTKIAPNAYIKGPRPYEYFKVSSSYN